MFPDMDIGGRLRRLREDRKLSGYALAKAAGITPTQVKAIEDGLTRDPQASTVEKLASALGVSTDFLIREEEVPFGGGRDHDAARAEHAVDVPLRAVASGGRPIEVEDLDETYPVLRHLHRPGRYVIRIVGDSMYPHFWSGDLLLVEPAERAKDGTVVVVKVNGESTVKRIFKRKKGGFILNGNNPNFPPIETEPGEIEIIARVLKIVEGERP